MKDKTQQKKNTPAAATQGGTAREWIVSTLAGLGSGAVVVATAIRREFNEEVKNWPGMAGEDGLIKKYQKLLDVCDRKYEGAKNWRGHVTEKSGIKLDFSREVLEDFLYKKHDIQTEGVTGNGLFSRAKSAIFGTYQRHKNLGESNKKLDVWFKGATISIVVGVGVYNLLTSIATRKKTREIEDLILDKVLEAPEVKAHAAEHAQTAEPHTKVSHVTSHNRLQAADNPEIAVRA